MSNEVRVDPTAVVGLADDFLGASDIIETLLLLSGFELAVAGLPGSRACVALRDAAQMVDSTLGVVPGRLQSLAATAIATAARYEEADATIASALNAIYS
ncbi:MAG: hypothetical protein WAW17_06395 [Rhodococcus sp. (in: high G+C Gram-positive bacteria)]|uniref:hypothetical protein n=1 Tax=Rhodococcus sp. TaxID=1831 RepID=UPI003BB0E242